MKKIILSLPFALIFGCHSNQDKINDSESNTQMMILNPDAAPSPIADKKEHWRTIHNDSVLDNYYWMYDYFAKGPDSTKAVDYLKAENSYLDTVMSGTKKLQADLFTEMKARIKEKDESVPVFKNGYFYYTRTEEGKHIINIVVKKEVLTQKKNYYSI